MDDCVELARAFGERVAARFDLPVYLYARAATRARSGSSSPTSGAASTRASRRRSRQPAAGEPDFGPPRMHPSAGAVAVGARPFLIAYNINLDSPDVDLAKRIARRSAESGGGLPMVQANGFLIEELDARAGVDEPARLRGRRRCGGSGTRSPGSPPRRARPSPSRSSSGSRRWRRSSPSPTTPAPADAPVEERLAAAAAYLKLRDSRPLMVLEQRLAAARGRRAGERPPIGLCG